MEGEELVPDGQDLLVNHLLEQPHNDCESDSESSDSMESAHATTQVLALERGEPGNIVVPGYDEGAPFQGQPAASATMGRSDNLSRMDPPSENVINQDTNTSTQEYSME